MSSSDPAILVTGASGLVGAAVWRRLVARGTTVLPVDREPRGPDSAAIVACDVTDIHRLHALAMRQPIAGIVHCGAFSGPMVARDTPTAMVQVNIVGTANILELARIHGAARVVFCSSCAVYGNTGPGPVKLDAPLRPTSLYGASKVASEQLVAAYSGQYGVSGVSLRLSWIYGPGRTTDCTIRTMIEDALAGRTTRLPYGADFHRQYIHVEDAADALIAALDRPGLSGKTYAVNGGTYVTLAEVADIVRHVLPQARIELANGKDPLDDVQAPLDVSAAVRDLDFHPSVTLEQGVRRYCDWLSRSNRHPERSEGSPRQETPLSGD